MKGDGGVIWEGGGSDGLMSKGEREGGRERGSDDGGMDRGRDGGILEEMSNKDRDKRWT